MTSSQLLTDFTVDACVAWSALALVVVVAVFAGAMDAGVRFTLVDIWQKLHLALSGPNQ